MTAEPDRLRSLIESAREGDMNAYEAAVEGCRTQLERSVRARLGQFGVAALETDEIVQETLVRGLQAIERFRFDGPDSLCRWLIGISRRVILASARENRAVAGLEDARRLPAKDVTPSRSMSREERFHRLRSALGRLTEPDREVIVLSRIEGLTTSEIAARVGCSQDAVRQRLSRALRRLRSAFGETESLTLPRRSLDDGGATNERERGSDR